MTHNLHDVVVVGTSLAGLRAAEGLRAGGYTGRLHMVGEEPHLPYNRPPLSKEFVLGKMPATELAFKGADQLEAMWHLADPAIDLDPRRMTVHLESGRSVAYDALIIATGVRPRWPDALARGVGRITLRTVEDASLLADGLARSSGIIVMGAGFIGCEVAASASSLGIKTALIDQSPAPLAALLGDDVASTITDLHREHGVATHFATRVAEVHGDTRVEGVTLADGSTVEGDLLLVGIGGQPSTEWLEGSGALIDNGVVCDETLKVRSADCTDLGPVWAVGDIARWPHRSFGGDLMRVEHWTNAALSGLSAAQGVLGNPQPYTALPEFWSDQYGVNIRGIGRFGIGCEMRLEEGSPAAYRFVASYWRAGKLSGALSFGMTRELARWRRRIGKS
ncbi:NAD(P)/FAD-dependent oxidoreductase [Nocardia sp. CA-135953]|uniref:NAD(P)/FAD-dependent oxidoreductase n=1 Tax=Nocardia sp. CA-135953 TaxID=3239978 RepID=UPI003D9903BD